MRFSFKLQQPDEWRKWFAWRPICICEEGYYEHLVWLEYVERSPNDGVVFGSWWKYRLINETNN